MKKKAPKKRPNVMYFEEKVRKAQCLNCGHIFIPRTKFPIRCSYCQTKFTSQEQLDELKIISQQNKEVKATTG